MYSELVKLEAVETAFEFLREQPLKLAFLGAAFFLRLGWELSPSLVSSTTVMLDYILDTAYRLLC